MLARGTGIPLEGQAPFMSLFPSRTGHGFIIPCTLSTMDESEVDNLPVLRLRRDRLVKKGR